MTSNAELIERLRACDTFVSQPQMLLIREAADVITALEERIRVLSEAALMVVNDPCSADNLRNLDAALNQSNDDYCGIVVVDEGGEDGE